ncbi:arginine repressor [Streptococcus oriscaviae]|uniref:Arginine repressor n=1 Tax=Streptococcus oriscaviae TaxID=2781599 RepID=A0ABX7YME7_9STRE|nr:arginine repressor [Streptococcus oriscaviae]QUE54997.1 arginine repressor [Streptococcus oriscaviae]
MNKKERLQVIKDLVVRYPIDTQEEIVERLKEMGVHATQATVSRDIKELGIIKVPSPEKGYIYGLPKSGLSKVQSRNVLSLASMDKMMNINLVPGSTAVVKRQILEQFEELIFSIIVDDDSILIIVKDEANLPRLEETIRVW